MSKEIRNGSITIDFTHTNESDAWDFMDAIECVASDDEDPSTESVRIVRVEKNANA